MDNMRIVVILMAAMIGLSTCEAPPEVLQEVEDSLSIIPEMPTPAIIAPALNVLDLEATEAFYVNMLGMKVMLRLGEKDAARQEVTLNFSGDLYAPESSLLLNYSADRAEPYTFDGFSRIAFRVKDVALIVERMRAAGHKIIREPRLIKGTSIKLAFVEDPNGALVELIEGMASAQQLKREQ
ncbi:MAG TPA: hypothetical protein DGZ24_02735 [Rhodospirillaceae bacterium]|nr:hypothetical protein [Candidatus Neomarinimicrobiota bacterium]HCX14216.1 hypothetical protein [Rhodospirillaceae bacterium]